MISASIIAAHGRLVGNPDSSGIPLIGNLVQGGAQARRAAPGAVAGDDEAVGGACSGFFGCWLVLAELRNKVLDHEQVVQPVPKLLVLALHQRLFVSAQRYQNIGELTVSKVDPAHLRTYCDAGPSLSNPRLSNVNWPTRARKPLTVLFLLRKSRYFERPISSE